MRNPQYITVAKYKSKLKSPIEKVYLGLGLMLAFGLVSHLAQNYIF